MIKILKLKQKTNLLRKFVFIIAVFFTLVSFTNAQIIITEIMYNPDSSDAGKEWIEIYNNGNENVDLTGWKLFEANTNHKIIPTEEEGSLSIQGNSFAIIVDKVDKFKENYPSFSGLVFDSAYSLSNTGENFIIRDSNLGDIDSAGYSSDLGADGDGNSLQLINGSWIASSPTMGKINNSSSNAKSFDVSENKTVIENSYTIDFPISPQIFAEAGENRSIIVGADTMFNARGFGIKKEPLQNARYSWSFGEGGLKEGQNVLYTYKYPSKYVVVLNVSSGGYTASDRIIVEALPADIIITEVNQTEGFIELHNRSRYELNLSWWRVRSGSEYFSMPKDTIILPNNKIRLFNQITKFSYLDLTQTYLLYPNGDVVNKYSRLEQITSYPPSLRGEAEAIQEVAKKQNTNSKDYQTKPKAQNTNIDAVDINEELEIDQLAFAGGIDKDDNNLFNKWTFLLIGLVLISVVGVLFTKGLEIEEEIENRDDELKPEDFKIIN